MSNAKVRARRRRRGNRAWTKAMQPEVYWVVGQTPWTHIRQPGKSNFWKQLEAAAEMQPKLEQLIRERYPYAVFVHDECVIEGSTAEIDALAGRIEVVMKDWHTKGSHAYAATLRTESATPNVYVHDEARKNMKPLAYWAKLRQTAGIVGMRPLPQIFPPDDDDRLNRTFIAELDRQDAIRESCKDDLAP